MFELVAVLIVIAIIAGFPAMMLYLSFRQQKTIQDSDQIWREAADTLGFALTGEGLEDLRMEGQVDGYPVVLNSRVTRETYRDRRGQKRTVTTYHFGHELHLHHPRWEGAEGLLKYQQRPMLYDDPRPGISDKFLQTFQLRGEQSPVTDRIYADPTIQQTLIELASSARQFSLTNGLLYRERGQIFTSPAEIVAGITELAFLARLLDEAMARGVQSDSRQANARSLFASATAEAPELEEPQTLPGDNAW